MRSFVTLSFVCLLSGLVSALPATAPIVEGSLVEREADCGDSVVKLKPRHEIKVTAGRVYKD